MTKSLPSNFQWAQILPEKQEELGGARSSLVTFYALGPQRVVRDVGSGFIIAGNSEMAIVMTARHVLDFATDVQNPSIAAPSSPFAPERRLNLADADKFKAVWFGGGTAVLLDVKVAHYATSLDLAVCVVQPHNKDVPFAPYSIALATRHPSIGQEVGVMSCLIRPATEITPPQTYDGIGQTLQIQNRVFMRLGRVTGVYPEGHRQYGWPCFTASMPTEPGMSGGLALLNIPGENYSACGVLCADCSPPEAKDDNKVAGESVFGSAWSALGLSVPVVVKGSGANGSSTLFDLIKSEGLLPALGGLDHITIEKDADGNIVAVHYEDADAH